MSKFCEYCGAPLKEGVRFCTSCGHSVTQSAQPSEQNTYNQNQYNGRSYTQQQPSNTQQPPQQAYAYGGPTPQPPKKKNGLMYVLIGLVVVAAMAVSAVIVFPSLNPLRQKDDKKEVAEVSKNESNDGTTQLNQELPQTEDSRGLSSEKPMQTEPLGNSDPLDYSPLEGFHIKAEKDAFKENTTIKMTPLTTLSETALTAVEQIENEGFLIVDGYEVNAGLEDDEIMPGEYTVEIDLSTLDVNPKLHPFLTVFRVGDDGNYYEYSTELKDGKLVYRSDQNSSILLAVIVGLTLAPVGYDLVERGLPYTGYFWRKDVLYFRETYEGVTFDLCWHPKDLGQDELVERIKEITKNYEDRKEELYRKYEEEQDRFFDATNGLEVYSRGKTVAEVLLDAIENDEEIKELKIECEDPEIVEYAIKCTKLAIGYLKDRFIEMPTGVVEIVSKPGLTALANATPRTLHEGYIEIDLKRLMNATPENRKKDRNNFLLTMTHEMLHVCQQKYRAFWADAIRYDELVAVFSEEAALIHFMAEGLIEEDAIPELSSTDYWNTLKLPIDKYYGREKEQKDVMKFEGYNLGLFVKFLEKKTGKNMYAAKLMNARSYFKEGGVSKPLMRAFDLSEQEFDTYYRLFILSNKDKMANAYNEPGHSENYEKNKVKMLSRGGKERGDVRVEGSYSGEIRGFKQPVKDPMNLIVVMDEGFAAEQPECLISPVDKYINIPKGFYIPALDEKSLRDKLMCRDILEIHGALGNASTTRTTGYTVYVWDKTRKPQAREDDEHLIIKMPKNSVMADDGIVDGYELTIEAENGKTLHKVIMPTFFEKEVKIDKKELYGRKGRNQELLLVKITLCEFIRMKDNSRLRGEESYVREFTLSGYNRAENTGYGEPDEPEEPNEPDEPGDIDEGDEPNVKYCWQLVDTKVESKPNDGASHYSAQAGSHQRNGVYIGNEYKEYPYSFSATIQAPPKNIEAGTTLVLHATLEKTAGSHGYIFEEASLSFEDESIPMGFTNGSIGKVTKLKGSTKVIIGGDSSGSWDYEIRIPAGSESSRKALNFFSCGSRTHWVYEWKEVSG